MQNAIDRIVEASELPLSIVIVGVGAANFKLMVRNETVHFDFCPCAYRIASMPTTSRCDRKWER